MRATIEHAEGAPRSVAGSSDRDALWLQAPRNARRSPPRRGAGAAVAATLLLALAAALLPGARADDARAVPEFIAHAGGAVGGVGYTNSRDALDANYARGHRFFELDFCWTSDDRLALIHDWQGTWSTLFEADGETPTLSRFLDTPTRSGFSQLSLETLLDWLRAHPDAFVVTDVKERNLEALQEISRAAGPLRGNFIPQIYTPDEFDPARGLGFDRIIFTVYRSGMDAAQTVSFARDHALWALTVSEHVAQHWDLGALVAARRPPIFVHTINAMDDFERLQERGFHGVYTDHLPN